MATNNRTQTGASNDSFTVIPTSLRDNAYIKYLKSLGIDPEALKKKALAPFNKKEGIVAVFQATGSRRYFVCFDEKFAEFYRGIMNGKNGEGKLLRELPAEEYSKLKNLLSGNMDCACTQKKGQIKQGCIVLENKIQRYIIYTPYRICDGELLKDEKELISDEKDKIYYKQENSCTSRNNTDRDR